ncbi:MAG: PD-(D/E)XK nuclease family protein [Myxococcota bacterium]
MWEATERWLTDRIRRPAQWGQRVLVLARTRATVSLVRRWAALHDGVAGLDVATPSSLATQVIQPRVLELDREDPEPPAVSMPEQVAIAARIGDRPGLAEVARRWVRYYRLAVAAGTQPKAPDWLVELAATGWGEDPDERSYLGLLEAARHSRSDHGVQLGEMAWDRVVALGYGVPPTVIEPWERALLDAVGAERPEKVTAPEMMLRSLTVPDVAAEARVAVTYAHQDPEGTLILVSSEGTARRVRDALRRSGLGCAWRDRLELRTHELASVVARCAPWFQTIDPWVQVGDLAAVFGQLALNTALHPAAEALLDRRLDHGGFVRPEAQLSRRGVVQVLEDARLLEAPLSRWISRMAELQVPRSDGPSDRRRAARAAAVEVRLQILQATLAGEPLDEAFSDEPLDFDEDDFDAIVAELLGDESLQIARGQTLGAIRAFLVACRVDIAEDPVARAILAALGRRADWDASPVHVAHALRGSVDPGVLPQGVDVMTYPDWDGRPARQVLLLDVHDKGIARRPTPDPLLEDRDLEAMGALTGSGWVAHQLAQARRAAAQAETVLAIVSERDADGREVVAPIRLERIPMIDPPEVPSYGTLLEGLPESRAMGGLVRGLGRPVKPEHPDPILSHLAVQATVEWYRDGRGPRDLTSLPPSPARRVATLEDWLVAEPEAPSWALPYLGHASEVPAAWCPPGPHSATGLLTDTAHCLYRAFASHVLDLKPLAAVTEDLDPKEVGQAVHDALQRASRGVQWRASDEERDDAMAHLVRSLSHETQDAFDQAVERFGALSEARDASARGRLDRWNRHWPSFAASRLGKPPNVARDKQRNEFVGQVREHPAFRKAVRTIRRIAPAAEQVTDWMLVRWLLEVLASPAQAFLHLSPDLQRSAGSHRQLPHSMLVDIQDIVEHPDVEALRTVHRNLHWRQTARNSPVVAVAAEVPFGLDTAEPAIVMDADGKPIGEMSLGPVHLPLGRETMPVRGRIDRIMVMDTPHGTLLEITDYKTGRPPPGWKFRQVLHQLSDPQLLVYALVLQQIRERPDVPAPFRGARIAAVSWDHVRNTFQEPERRWRLEVPDTDLLVDTAVLDRARETIGHLVDRGRSGRWSLRPRSETCPSLSSFGHNHCPYAGACRLRGLPPTNGEEKRG